MNRGFFANQRQKQNEMKEQQSSSIHLYIDNDLDVDEMIDIAEMYHPSSTAQPKQFQFDLNYLLESKDKHIKSKVNIRGTLNDEQKYDVERKIQGTDKKHIKMSPSWLSRQRENIAQGILVKAFGIKPSVATNMDKKEGLKLCYEKLGMLTAHKKIELKALMLFTDEEIKIIEAKMPLKIDAMDLVTIIFNYFASQDMYVQHEDFMDLLDDCILHHLYSEAVCDIYKGIHQIMMTAKSAQKFDSQFIFFQQNREKQNEFQKLKTIFKQLLSNVFLILAHEGTLISLDFVHI